MQLQKLQNEALQAYAVADSSGSLQQQQLNYTGKKGALTALLKHLGKLPATERPLAGKHVNEVKKTLAQASKQAQERLQEEEETRRVIREKVDISLPGKRSNSGALHPIQAGLDEICAIFTGMGFDIAEGPEIEDEFHNFDALNIPPEHPARAMHDTFFVEGGQHLLRTHTSPVQIRSMQNGTPPLAIVAPGRVFRCDHDVSHSPMFHQVEVFMVDQKVTMAELKGVLKHFLSTYFGRDLDLRMRPSYFPFTEPSCEVDISCVLCSGKGCPVCKRTGWLEVLGSGMIHPNVLSSVDIDPQKWSGFAFGLGVERLVMLKQGIPDLRIFFENDVRFLRRLGA
ncbi:MAG: phenylalanine--tRNA ligase subunit alpha [Mariprofundales bacterium]